MTIPSFAATREEFTLIEAIAKRAYQIGIYEHGEMMKAIMDVTACNANGCPLLLADLAEADKEDFVHDVAGIKRHIDRETGQLQNCFTPRFAQRGPKAVA